MKKMIKNLLVALVSGICVATYASPLSAPVKSAIKASEKAAAKLGFKGAEKAVVRGGAKLAAVTAEREAAKKAAHGTIKAIAKEATTKKILAVGAATTMVASGHEIADGIQEGTKRIGDGIGKAVEEHPEIAVPVAETLMSPAKYILIASILPIMVLLLWFLWPWFQLVRNASALAAGRRARRMQYGAVIDVTPASTCRSGFSRVKLVFVVAACLTLTILGVWRMTASRDTKIPEKGVGTSAADASHDKNCNGDAEAEQNARIARRKAVVERLHAAYADSLRRHYRNFCSEVGQVGSLQFNIVRSSISGVVEKFGTFSRCKDLFVSIVKDNLKGGDETGRSIKRDLEADYYRGLYAARDRVYDCLEAFVQNAESARAAFSLELEAELDTASLPGDEAYKSLLVECGERIEQKKYNLKLGQIDAGIALALEAICIRQTVKAAARILGKTAARQAGTMAVGAGSALADGPLPFCDAAAGVAIAACTAWSVWDVYKATKVLPEELRSSLEVTTRKCENQTLEEVRKTGAAIYNTYLAVASM